MYKKIHLLALLFLCNQFAHGAESNSLVGEYYAHIQAGYSIGFELRADYTASLKTWSFVVDGEQSQEHEENGVWALKDGRLRFETNESNYFVFIVKKGKLLTGDQGYILEIQESSLPPDDLVLHHRYYYGQPFRNATK